MNFSLEHLLLFYLRRVLMLGFRYNEASTEEGFADCKRRAYPKYPGPSTCFPFSSTLSAKKTVDFGR